jgi:hypothetical protein
MRMAATAESMERRCLVTRESRDPSRLVRFVVDPEGRVRPDLEQRLPGRGMWLSAERDVVDKAVGKNLFAKAARAQVRAEPDLASEVERLLARRALDTLGLARRAGALNAGFEQVRARLQAEGAAVLVAASDAARDGRAKLRRLAPALPVVTAFSSRELGAALGREMVVHAAVAPGGLARRLLCDVERLAGFRPDAVEWPERRAQSLGSSAIPATTGS